MHPGDKIADRFRIENPIGEGGMGVVYRAIDETTGRRVAVKTIAGKTSDEIARARREAMALSLLDHPNIVRHIAHGETAEGHLYLAMEWLEGTTLADRIDNTGLSLVEAVSVARQIASALAAAHEVGLLHRDLKPTNVILVGGDPNTVKLIDFGVARFSTVATSLTVTGTAMGTPGYMAPEQAHGSRELWPATDVFGLGVLLYECAAGRAAFTGANQAALMTKVVFAHPAPLDRHCPEAPHDLVLLVEFMLAKDPERRPLDGAAVIALLDKLGPIPPGPRRPLRRDVGPESDAPVTHCIVLVMSGHPNETVDPPSPEITRTLLQRATELEGEMRILATGAVVAHFQGAAEEVHARASWWADHARGHLPTWLVEVSSAEPDIASAAERCAKTVAVNAIAAIFGDL